jgi:hypothetical protein
LGLARLAAHRPLSVPLAEVLPDQQRDIRPAVQEPALAQVLWRRRAGRAFGDRRRLFGRLQASSSIKLGSRCRKPARAAVGVPAATGDLVIASRCGEVRIRRAELAEYDMRRSTIRRLRDDMRGSTIRGPRAPASDVAKIASSLRRLEPPARAARCAPVVGSPDRSTEPGSCRLPDRRRSSPHEGSHCRCWPQLSRYHSNLRGPASKAVALIHLDSDQMDAWQPAAQKKRLSPAALPILPGAAPERPLPLAVKARFRSMKRGPERRQPRWQCQNRRQPSSDASHAAAGLLRQEADPAWPWS